jgi:type IV pilus assembly protein PilC
MPVYNYKASNLEKQVQEGTLAAPSEEEVSQTLKKRGLDPISIKLQKTKSNISGKLPTIEKITFCRYVATMLDSGLSLVEGMPVLKIESKNGLMKQIIDDIIYHLEQGQPMSAALKGYPQVFDSFFITLVDAGEVSGTLADSFHFLEEQLRAEYSLSQKVKSALVYPAVVFVAMAGIGYLMLFFIMPQIGEVFLRMSIPLPAITRAIFNGAIAIAKFRLPLIALSLVSTIALIIFVRKPFGRRVIFKAITPIPIINRLLKQIDIARFCRIFSTLVASAVPITQSLEIALSSLSHPRYAKMKDEVIGKVSQGKNISIAFKDSQAFPPLLIQMISAGEKSGTIDTSLKDLADFYEEEVSEAVKKSTQLLEPMLMLIVGIGVGAMILAIIAPLYSVVGNLQNMQ